MNKLAKKQNFMVVAPDTFTQIKGWDDLQPDEQKTVISESQGLADEMINEGRSKLYQGKHLFAIREMLKPKGLWMQFLEVLAERVSPRTADRLVNTWESAKQMLPDAALEFVLAQGVDMVGRGKELPFGAYTEALKQFQAPTTGSQLALQKWWGTVTHFKREQKKKKPTGLSEETPPPVTEESLLKEAFRYARICFRQLPNNHKTRARWVHNLSGMMLSQLGVSNNQNIKPVAAPEEFLRGPGRPRNETEVVA